MKSLRLALISFFTLLSSTIIAQTVTGEWYGVGHIKRNGAYNSYLSEMVLRQKGNNVTGVFKYFFKKDSIKVKVTGTYFPNYRRLELKASPILNFLAKNSNGADCPMEGGFTLRVSSVASTLTGQFNPLYEYRMVCPAIDIKFTKYIPPAYTVEEETDTVETEAPIIDTIKQRQKDTARRQVPIVTRRDTTKLPAIVAKPVDPNENFIRELFKRKFEPVSPVIEVDADSLLINFYDNGEIDNDTISVFYNRKPVVTRQMLSKEPVSVRLGLDTSINEISMFAENLGRISPNTAVAIIYAGEQRFELNLSSSLQTNSTIRFRKKPKHIDPKNIN